MITVLLVPLVTPHLDGGEDKIIDDYLIDFGYSPEKITSKDKVTLAFNLVNKTTQEVIEPSNVWIRISSSKEVVFAGTFKPQAQHITFTYKFPYADKYTIDARFSDEIRTLTQTNFNLNVKKNYVKYIITLIIILLLSLIYKRYKK